MGSIVSTFDSKDRLLLAGFGLDTLEKRSDELGFPTANLFLDILACQNPYKCRQALFSPLDAATLPVNELIDSVSQLSSPSIHGLLVGFGSEHLVDRVNAVQIVSGQALSFALEGEACSAHDYLCNGDADDAEELKSYLKDVSSLRLPPSSSSDPALLAVLLGARDGGDEFDREVAGEDCFDCALRDTVLPLSRA